MFSPTLRHSFASPHFMNFSCSLTCDLAQGVLATLYRQRGNLRDCEAVLDMELIVLQLYTRSSKGAIAEQVC